MKKFSVFFLLLYLGVLHTNAQQRDVKDLYFDFLQIRLVPLNEPEAIKQGLKLLTRSSELNKKQVTSVTYHLARLYEGEGEMDKALPYYEKSILLNPDYYVPYRALGFYYFDQAIDLWQAVSRIDEKNTPNEYAKALDVFKIIAIKTNFYLEKAQACDPDEETLSMIEDLYKNLKDQKALQNLDQRLKSKSKKCVTLLDDE